MMDKAMHDDPSLIDCIIRSDEAELKRLGVDCECVADKLEAFLDSAKEGLESPVKLGPFTIRAQWDRGLIPCPLGEPGLFPKITAELLLPSGQVIRYSALSIHLIRAHGFFGEPDHPFRLEPKDMIVLLV
jgi:hypothetical protein